MRGTSDPIHLNTNKSYNNTYYSKGLELPEAALATQSIQVGSVFVTGEADGGVISSSYSRYIFEASQSHWRATANTHAPTINQVGDLSLVNNFTATGINVMHGYEIVGEGFTSLPPTDAIYQQDTDNKYGQLLQPSLIDSDGNLDTNTIRSSSYVLPAGDLFSIQQTAGANFSTLENTASYITDIKVTMESGNEATFKGLTAGSFLPVLVTHVSLPAAETGYIATTATDILAIY